MDGAATERIGPPFEKRADEVSPSTVTASLVGELPHGIVLPPALFEAADSKIASSCRKHRHEGTSVYRKSAGRHDTIVRPTNPTSSAAELYGHNLKSAEMDGHNLEARHATTAYSPQSTALAPLAVQVALPGERTRQPTGSSDSTPSSQSSQSNEPRRSSRWAEKVAFRAAQAAKAEAARADKSASGSMEALPIRWNWWLGVSAREAVRTFYG